MRPRRHPTDSLETEPLLLPTDAPARVAKWTAWLFLGVFGAGIVFACTVRLPETISVPFVLQSIEGAEPRAQLMVPESAFPRVKRGQEVRLRYNAYPYQRYGSTAAVLDHISPVAVDVQSSTIEATALLQAGPAGHGIEAQPGMRGEAQIVIARRTLLEKALEPMSGSPKPVGKSPS